MTSKFVSFDLVVRACQIDVIRNFRSGYCYNDIYLLYANLLPGNGTEILQIVHQLKVVFMRFKYLTLNLTTVLMGILLNTCTPYKVNLNTNHFRFSQLRKLKIQIKSDLFLGEN